MSSSHKEVLHLTLESLTRTTPLCQRSPTPKRARVTSLVLHTRTLHSFYGVRPSGTYTFQDQLGLVRGTKSKIEDGYATGTLPLRGVAVGDLAGAQPLRVQVVLENQVLKKADAGQATA